MTTSANPWADRYRAFADIETIKRRSRVPAEPLADLDKDPPQRAEDRMRSEFMRIFYPTQRACEIIIEIIQCALSHALAYYPDARTFMARKYGDGTEIEPYVPILLTGLAGVGKSQICKAIERLLSGPPGATIDVDGRPFPLVGLKVVRARARSSLAALLRPFASPEIEGERVGCTVADLPNEGAAWLYHCGTCLCVVDELQFASMGKTANTLITQALLAYSFMKTPFVVVMNYSLGHKLKRRRPEELHRLLGHAVVLLPDGPDSGDWSGLLCEYQNAVPGVFDFAFRDQAHPLWKLTAGVKRHLATLLVLAYRLVRRAGRTEVTWPDIERAYVHSDFAEPRAEVEALIMHGIGSQALNEELRSPFALPASEVEAYERELRAARAAKVAAAALDASMTEADRKAKSFVEGLMNPPGKKSTTAPSAEPKSKRPRRTAASMREAGERFRKQLGPRS